MVKWTNSSIPLTRQPTCLSCVGHAAILRNHTSIGEKSDNHRATRNVVMFCKLAGFATSADWQTNYQKKINSISVANERLASTSLKCGWLASKTWKEKMVVKMNGLFTVGFSSSSRMWRRVLPTSQAMVLLGIVPHYQQGRYCCCAVTTAAQRRVQFRKCAAVCGQQSSRVT